MALAVIFFVKLPRFLHVFVFYYRNASALMTSSPSQTTNQTFRVLLTGPVFPESKLEEKWEKRLSTFERKSVIFCAFGSQHILEKNQLQELLLGFEESRYPFFIALKPPIGCDSVEEAYPDGFEERVRERGIVNGGWVQQPLILQHPSIGCFVNHCGFGSMWESLMSDCQIVLVPHLGDQILNTRLLAGELKLAKEVKRDQNGCFSKEGLSEAIKAVMSAGDEVCETLKRNSINAFFWLRAFSKRFGLVRLMLTPEGRGILGTKNRHVQKSC